MIVYTWISSPNGRMITAICRVAIITIQKKIKLYLCWMWVFCPANHETLKQVQWKMRGKQFLQSALIFPKSFPAVSFWFDTAAPQAEFSDIYHYVSFCSHILILFMILSAFPDLQPLSPPVTSHVFSAGWAGFWSAKWSQMAWWIAGTNSRRPQAPREAVASK